MPKDLEPDELVLYRAFASLRRRVVQVGHLFEDRVHERLDDADRPRVRLDGTLTAALTQLLNLVSAFMGDSPMPPSRPPSPEEDSHVP